MQRSADFICLAQKLLHGRPVLRHGIGGRAENPLFSTTLQILLLVRVRSLGSVLVRKEPRICVEQFQLDLIYFGMHPQAVVLFGLAI